MPAVGASQTTVPCPACGREILAQAAQCRHCRAWLHKLQGRAGTPAAAGQTAPASADLRPPGAGTLSGPLSGTGEAAEGAGAPPVARSFDAAAGNYSKGQSITQLLWLTVLSFGLYEVYWFYRNWKALAEHTGLKINPVWRTLGLLVPFVNVFMVYHQFRMVWLLAESPARTPVYSPGIMTLAYFALVGVSNAVGPIWPLAALTVLPIIPVQFELNRYWAGEQPGLPLRRVLYPLEVAVLAGGALAFFALAARLLGGG